MTQISAAAFQPYDPANAATIVPGPFALYQVAVESLVPALLNAGSLETASLTDGYDELTSNGALTANLLSNIGSVVIGPGGTLFLVGDPSSFLALLSSGWGSTDPFVNVNVIANYSSLTTQQFWATMEQNNLLYPVNDGVLQAINPANGAPLPSSLTGLTNDPYVGLDFAILNNQNSQLFTTTSNLSGATGSAKPGLDQTAALYSDAIWADALRTANAGLGLPYLSPGDLQLATQWSLNGANSVTLPTVGTVTVAQLPGYVLPSAGITITGTISNATLANGTLDGSEIGTFNQSTPAKSASFKGLRALDLGTVTVGSNAPGFIMQLGNDLGGTVTLSGANTYTGGTTILDGVLVITSDASLGAAAGTAPINLSSIAASVEADNGIIFDTLNPNPLTAGRGFLQIGSQSSPGVNSFATDRPIAVGGEVAVLSLNGNTLTLTGPILSLGMNSSGSPDLSVEDNSKAANGVLVLAPASGGNPNFYGNWILWNGTLRASSDAALGNVSGPSYEVGQIELNGGTFQAGASFASVRSLTVGAEGSVYDTNGFSTSWSGNLLDVHRTLTIANSSTVNAGTVSFGTFEIGGTATINVDAGTEGTTVTLTGGIIRDPAGTLILQPDSGTLGTTEKVLDTSTGAGASNKVTDGIVAPWMVSYDATPSNPTPANPYSFLTYGSNGYTATAGNSTNILTATAASTVQQSTSITGKTVTANLNAYALSLQSGSVLALNSHTLTLGDGTDPAGLILNGGATISAGTLATRGSELVLWLAGKSSAANTISAQLTGSGGLTIAGGLQANNLNLDGKDSTNSGSLNLTTATAETGAVTIDSGVLNLKAVNAFLTSVPGVYLEDSKQSPSPVILNVLRNNTFTALQSAGARSTVTVSDGAILTIGNTTNNLNSTLSSTLTEAGAAVIGALTKNGSGLLDMSGSASISLVKGSTVIVNSGAFRIGAGGFAAGASNIITLAANAELQYAGTGGSQFGNAIQGAGTFHLLGGTVQLTSQSNTYTGGTVIETGATLDVTTANLPTDGNIVNAGGTLVFDQTSTGTFSGVMSDGALSGGPSDPNAMAALATGPSLSGTLIKDDSTGGDGGNVIIGAVQTYSGATYIEAGTLTLGVADAIAASSGVTLGRIGGTDGTSTLALGANETIAAVSSDAGNATSVVLNGDVLTLATSLNASSAFGGSIVDGSASGRLVKQGEGTATLTGASTFTGGVTLAQGTLELGNAAASGTGTITFRAGSSATLKIDQGDTPSNLISGFTAGNSIDLAGVGTETNFSYNSVNDALLLSGGTQDVSLNLGALLPDGDDFTLATDSNGGTLVTISPVATQVICFYPGTQIATPDGGRAVETLAIGDAVLTHEGRVAPILWIGRQSVSRRFADPLRVLPIRIREGAIGESLPSRDLLVSPDHAVLVDGVLIQAGALVNGGSVSREYKVPESYTYYHIELADHALILAEDLPAETFVDNADRMGFDNWREHLALWPNGRTIAEMLYPRAKSTRQVPASIRCRIAARATAAVSAAHFAQSA